MLTNFIGDIIMSRSYKSKYQVGREIGPMYIHTNSKWSKNFLNRKLRHDWQDQVKIDVSYGDDDWVCDFPAMWEEDFEDYDSQLFKVMRDAA